MDNLPTSCGQTGMFRVIEIPREDVDDHVGPPSELPSSKHHRPGISEDKIPNSFRIILQFLQDRRDLPPISSRVDQLPRQPNSKVLVDRRRLDGLKLSLLPFQTTNLLKDDKGLPRRAICRLRYLLDDVIRERHLLLVNHSPNDSIKGLLRQGRELDFGATGMDRLDELLGIGRRQEEVGHPRSVLQE